MPRKILTDEERIENKRLARQKYRQSEKGKEKYAKANKAYQKGEKYKEYKKEYYKNNKIID